MVSGEGRLASTGSTPGVVPTREAPLGAPEQERRGQVLGRPGTPIPVRVWVHAGTRGHQQYEGVAIAWTATQVQVRYSDDQGREGVVWVWANAVTRTEHAVGGPRSGAPHAREGHEPTAPRNALPAPPRGRESRWPGSDQVLVMIRLEWPRGRVEVRPAEVVERRGDAALVVWRSSPRSKPRRTWLHMDDLRTMTAFENVGKWVLGLTPTRRSQGG